MVGAIWRRRNGSLGSVREILRLRVASECASWTGGGRSKERRIGGSRSCVGIGQNDLRFGEDAFGVAVSWRHSSGSISWRCILALRVAVGLEDVVVLVEDVDRITVFLQGSHNPEAYDIGCLHVLHMAIGMEEVVVLLRNLKSKLDLAEAMNVADVRGVSEVEVRCVLDAP